MKQRFGTHIPSVGKRKKERKSMLIQCDAEEYLKYIKDDPVRPDLFEDDSVRFTGNFRVYADIEKQGFETVVNAMVCVALAPFLPQSEETLVEYASGSLEESLSTLNDILDDTAGRAGIILCPYSLWSYKRGAGKKLINQLIEAAPFLHQDVDHIITMSPPTKMAMNFHLGNGATLLSLNDTTINYEYELPEHSYDPNKVH